MASTARNMQRAYLIDAAAGNMAEGITSRVIDFKEMVIGSVQAVWAGADAQDGEITLWVSNLPDPATFVPLDGGKRTLSVAPYSRMWQLGVIGYRYMMATYTPGANTMGTMFLFALGKISK